MPVTKVTLSAQFYEQSGQPFERVKLKAVLYGIDVELQQYVAQDTQEAFSDVAGLAQLELFSNAAGTRFSYYRITATTPQGIVISDSNVSIPTTDCNLVDVEGNWSGEIFVGGSNATITGNLTVIGNTTLNTFTGKMIGGTINGITELELPHGAGPAPTAEARIYWSDASDRLTVGNGTTAEEMVTTDNGQTLTNKAIDLGLNNLTGTLANFNAACSDADFAPIASPIFTGNPQAPTPPQADNDTTLATTAFVHTVVQATVSGGLSDSIPLMNDVADPGVATLASRDDHVHPVDTSRAAASAETADGTSFTPSGTISATDVQAAIQELDSETQTSLAGKAPSSAATATGTSFTPVGGVAATNVQAAIAELDTEKAALAGAAFTGAISAPVVSVVNGPGGYNALWLGTRQIRGEIAGSQVIEMVNAANSQVTHTFGNDGSLVAGAFVRGTTTLVAGNAGTAGGSSDGVAISGNGTIELFNSTGAFIDFKRGAVDYHWRLFQGPNADDSFNIVSALGGGLNLTYAQFPVLKVAGGYRSQHGVNGSIGGNSWNFFWNNAALEMWVDSTNIGTVNVTSDRRIKQNINTEDTPALAQVLAWNVVKYEHRDVDIWKSGRTHLGFIADELQVVSPLTVLGEPDALTESGGIQPQTLDLVALVATLTKAVQELTTRVAELESK